MALKPHPTPYDSNKIDVKEYISLVGALQYLTHTQLDIVHPLNKSCQQLQDQIKGDTKPIKRILRYVKGTLHYGFMFLSQSLFKLYIFCATN